MRSLFLSFLLSQGIFLAPALADEPFPIPAKSKAADSSDDANDIGRPMRRSSRQVMYFGIAPAWFSNMSTTGTGYLFAGTYGWDLNDAIIKLNAEMAFNDSATWANVGVGVQGYLMSGEHVPYVAADFGLTYARALFTAPLPRTAAGFTLGAQVGMQLFRTANVQFDVGARYAIVLKRNGVGYPGLFSIRVGIWF